MNSAKCRGTNRGGYLSFIHSTFTEAWLTADERVVLALLMRRADKTGRCWPSYQSIGDYCFGKDCTHPITRRRKAIKAVKGLVEQNIVRVERKGHARTQTNIFTIVPERYWLPAPDGAPFRAAAGASDAPNNPADIPNADAYFAPHGDNESAPSGDNGFAPTGRGRIVQNVGAESLPDVSPIEVSPIPGDNAMRNGDRFISPAQRAADYLAGKPQRPYRSKEQQRLDRMRERAVIQDIIYWRHGDDKTTLITSNLTPLQLSEQFAPETYQRVEEMAAVIRVRGKVLRKIAQPASRPLA